MTGGQAHHPLDERGAQSTSIISWPGGTSSEDGFPPSDGGSVIAPVNVGLPRLYVGLVRSLSAAVGVGMSGSTTWDSGGRKPSLALRPGVPVSDALGVGRSRAAALARVRSPREPCWFGLPLRPSVPRGVGSSLGLLVGAAELGVCAVLASGAEAA
ncbi:hypothetical protein H114_00762 [Streptomyces gancidicus BKS 13-15]|uniref:Uncharacterized protein n=1 Tax=Streptomyces gancidicus BKS 13-15 TaxID=1284664 RepID=M3DMA3_STREZ|nr:hypothetical protein H114_00762 [Streptomyces gancidicus BKS 13-15]